MFLMILTSKFLFFSSRTVHPDLQIEWEERQKKDRPILPRKRNLQIYPTETACKFFCDYDNADRKAKRRTHTRAGKNPLGANEIGRQNYFLALLTYFRRMRRKESFPIRELSDRL